MILCSHYRSRLFQNKKHGFDQYTNGCHFCAAHMALKFSIIPTANLIFLNLTVFVICEYEIFLLYFYCIQRRCRYTCTSLCFSCVTVCILTLYTLRVCLHGVNIFVNNGSVFIQTRVDFLPRIYDVISQLRHTFAKGSFCVARLIWQMTIYFLNTLLWSQTLFIIIISYQTTVIPPIFEFSTKATIEK